ncbi:MAG: hypothetical protein LBV04_05120 [Deferribacteraceae bacterium]|jgi:hypothetical protein|nr:hypothetical protein [Deferribacteraceae bacterium]
MKQIVYILLILIMLTACAKTQTFYFNSNVPDVWVATSEDNGCFTPCKLSVDFNPEDSESAEIHVGNDLSFEADAYVYDDNDDLLHRDDFDAKKPRRMGSIIDSELRDMIEYSIVIPIYLPFGTSTTSSITIEIATIRPSVTTTDLSSGGNGISYVFTPIYYDTNSFYIYVGELNTYTFGNYEVVGYALGNFEPMRQELFATEQPYISAFAELSALTNIAIQELLLASEDALDFLDMVTAEKLKMIMGSDLDEQEKVENVAKFLSLKERMVQHYYNYAAKQGEDFVSLIMQYLKDETRVAHKEQVLPPASDAWIEISHTEIKEIGVNPAYPLNGNYRLMDDGTLTGIWTPIGEPRQSGEAQFMGSQPFMGKFDGNGHTIKIEQMNETSLNNGLFGIVDNAVIENLTIELATQNLIYKPEHSTHYRNMYIGALAGEIQRSVISNIHIIGQGFTFNVKNIDYDVGGLAGQVYESKISRISVKQDIIDTTDDDYSYGSIGGLVGTSLSGDFENSFHQGALKTEHSAGGLIGSKIRTGTTVRNSYHAGAVAGYSAGGLVGGDCQNASSSIAIDAQGNGKVFIGSCEPIKDNLSPSETTQQSTYTSEPLNWDFENIWQMGKQYPELR